MKKHIVCLGDSNTHGYNAYANERFGEEQRWTCRLQRLLGEEYLVLEEGLNGRTTTFEDPCYEGMPALPYIRPCLCSHEPVSLLVIMLGTNDTKERFGAGAPVIASALQRLVEKAQDVKDCWKDGVCKILIVAPQNIGREYIHVEVAGVMGRGCAEKSEALAAEYAKVAEFTGCDFLDANQVIHSAPNDVDYMHLTEEGHKELAEGLAAKIREILKEA